MDDPTVTPPQPAPPPVDPRRRLRELLSVPERDRTDAQWDEIVELEIQLAPGNRINPGPQGNNSNNNPNPNKQAQHHKHRSKMGPRQKPQQQKKPPQQ